MFIELTVNSVIDNYVEKREISFLDSECGDTRKLSVDLSRHYVDLTRVNSMLNSRFLRRDKVFERWESYGSVNELKFIER